MLVNEYIKDKNNIIVVKNEGGIQAIKNNNTTSYGGNNADNVLNSIIKDIKEGFYKLVYLLKN